jgi:predicted amidohydrolase
MHARLTFAVIRSVEKGMEILPPFNTPLGSVGLSICFDVSLVAQVPKPDGEVIIVLHATCFTAALP